MDKEKEEYIRKHKSKIDWNYICQYEELSEKFIREFKNEVSWNYIFEFQNLSYDFICEFQNKINWSTYCQYKELNENFIRIFQDKVNWYYISIYQKLSEEFIREFQDKVNWKEISLYQKLSENFIREFQDKVDWTSISIKQKLSEEFIREFQDKVNLYLISEYQKLSEEFIYEFRDFFYIDKEYNWLYKTEEEKLDYIKNNTTYEISEDNKYIIAYKSCKRNGYSKYNFQYKYEVGGIYESHCDCNINNESSFGLSAWIKDKAIEYCNEKLFKVKIYIKDIGAIIQGNNKIRCFKQEILEEIKLK
jgi:hypothetical protein